MKSVIMVTQELAKNLMIIHRLAMNELITKHKDSFLGVVWLWINPTIQIVIYWIVFGSLRNSKPVDGIPFFLWLSVGYILWNYISSVITPASRSIVAKIGIITKMRFTVSIIPAVVILSELYIHLMLLVTVVILLVSFGIPITLYYFQIIYFIFATTMFLYAISIFNSSITTVLRDYQHIVYNVMRALFFFTPVVYQLKTSTGVLGVIMKFNPLSYVVEGYRDAMLFQKVTMISSLNRGLYFWGITITLYVVGSILHVRMRKNLLDHA